MTTQTHTQGYEGTPLPQRGARSFRRLPQDLRQLAREAYALWRELAVKRSNPYCDHSACLLAGRMAVEATRWEDGLTILAAIRQRMDEKSSPRWIPEWSREYGGECRRVDHLTRMAEAKAALEDIDPDVLRVLVAFGRAKAADMRVTTESWSCVVCHGITDGRCAKCAAPLHPRSCPNRHECVA